MYGRTTLTNQTIVRAFIPRSRYGRRNSEISVYINYNINIGMLLYWCMHHKHCTCTYHVLGASSRVLKIRCSLWPMTRQKICLQLRIVVQLYSTHVLYRYTVHVKRLSRCFSCMASDVQTKIHDLFTRCTYVPVRICRSLSVQYMCRHAHYWSCSETNPGYIFVWRLEFQIHKSQIWLCLRAASLPPVLYMNLYFNKIFVHESPEQQHFLNKSPLGELVQHPPKL